MRGHTTNWRASLSAADLPPVSLLRAFDAAGRHRSFKDAAAFLSVTPSTISHQIADLETYLGVQLFERGARGVSLTAAGSELLDDVSAAFSRLRQATARIRQRGQQVNVRISANPFLAAEVLVPLIESFDQHFPDLTIHISATEEVLDPRDGDVDFCVRFGDGSWPGLEVMALYPVYAVPVAAPQARSAPYARIDYPFRGHAAWQIWEARGGPAIASNGQMRSFSNFGAAMRAAEQGLGMTLALWPAIKPWVEAGRVERIGDAALPIGDLYLVSRSLSPSQPSLLAVGGWLKRVLRSSADVPAGPS